MSCNFIACQLVKSSFKMYILPVFGQFLSKRYVTSRQIYYHHLTNICT